MKDVLLLRAERQPPSLFFPLCHIILPPRGRHEGSVCCDEINQMFGGFAEIARKEGILALDSMAQKRSDEFMAYGIRLAGDGTEPEFIQAILETWLTSLVREQEMKGLCRFNQGIIQRLLKKS